MNNRSLFADLLIEAARCENEQDKRLCFCKTFIERIKKATPEELDYALEDVIIEQCHPYEEHSYRMRLYLKEEPSVFSASFNLTHSIYELEDEISFLKKRKARLMKENQELDDEKRRLNDYIEERQEEIEHYKELKEDFSRLGIFTKTKL